MKEIKFRAWESFPQIMHSNIQHGIYVDPDEIIPFEDVITYDYKVMQYTGLKDRDGVEIYEGDIIKTKELLWIVEPMNSVLENDCYGQVVTGVGTGNKYLIDKSILDGEVIGNIHEDEELLEDKQCHI